MERNIRLTIEYDGGGFHGWQKQPGLRTVQGELEVALETILRHPVTLYAAGRTDSGVHALGQVANVRTTTTLPAGRIRLGANALTGKDVVTTGIHDVEGGFHARFSARARHYIYLLLQHRSALWSGRALRVRRFPDAGPMNAAAAHLVGEHDFAAFSCKTSDQKDALSRVLYAQWVPWDRGLAFRIGAVRFLYRMVRSIVGRCLDVGAGREPPSRFRELLEQPPGRAESVAAACGLYLVSVDYEDVPGRGPWGPDCLPPWPVI